MFYMFPGGYNLAPSISLDSMLIGPYLALCFYHLKGLQFLAHSAFLALLLPFPVPSHLPSPVPLAQLLRLRNLPPPAGFSGTVLGTSISHSVPFVSRAAKEESLAGDLA